MKNIYFVFAVVFVSLLYSCGTNEKELCEDLLLSIDNETITGRIFICNATQPLQDFIDSEATIDVIGDSVTVDLRTLNNTFDTTLVFKYDCIVYEKSRPELNLSNSDKEGYINNSESFLFQFSYMCDHDFFSSF